VAISEIDGERTICAQPSRIGVEELVRLRPSDPRLRNDSGRNTYYKEEENNMEDVDLPGSLMSAMFPCRSGKKSHGVMLPADIDSRLQADFNCATGNRL
jgi:hypothetical protein